MEPISIISPGDHLGNRLELDKKGKQVAGKPLIITYSKKIQKINLAKRIQVM